MQLEFSTTLQFCMWYRSAHDGREEEAVHHGPIVTVVTPMDLPAPPGQTSLPLVITLQDGRVMRRRRHPVCVEWRPKSDWSDIAMLTVNIWRHNYKNIIWVKLSTIFTTGLEERAGTRPVP